jgi:hypothetical protein
MEFPDYTEGKAKFVLKEKGLVSTIDGNSCIGYVRSVCIEEVLASLAIDAGYKPGDSVEYYILIRKKH